MWDQSQIQYMQDVLGVVDLASLTPAGQQAAPAAALLILTPRLEPGELSLLNKILASVRLPQHNHYETEVYDGFEAANVILFDGGSGTREEVGGKWWHLPELKDMLGSSVQVTALKRTTWTLLQQLSQELA